MPNNTLHWQKDIVTKLTSMGMTHEQAMSTCGLIAEQRQLTYMEGYDKGYNEGYNDHRIITNRKKIFNKEI